MASGKTHDIINLTAFPFFAYYLKPESFSGFFIGYMSGTFFLSPDNDIFHSKPNKRWKFLRFIWKPYTKIFSHRGISHIPVIGMMIKLLYLLVFFLLVLTFIFVPLFFLKEYLNINFVELNINLEDILDINNIIYLLKAPFFVSFLIGLFLSEFVHIATDIIFSSIKKLRKAF